ncbi:MAG: hypothetical protein GSR86_01600 [Desulfurococcales archaeon]|nr:hypothetical protein [Desulfurococcales archaeon]
MPTVHLSLPDGTYRELKRRAGELGIQVTDLIKLYIKMGLDKGFTGGGVDDKALVHLSNRIERLEREYRMKLTMLEGRYRQVEEMLSYILERVEGLEDLVSEARSMGKLVGKQVYEETA